MKKLLWRSTFTLIGSLLVMAVFVPPSQASESVDDPGTVWIVGEQHQLESGYCFSKKVKQKRVRQELQVLNDTGTWVKLVSSPFYTKSAECSKKNPYTVTYYFTAQQFGVLVDPEVQEYELQAREYLYDGPGEVFTKTLYPTKQDHKNALLKAFLELLR